jgi:predicted small lipoprotein YifL
MRTLIATSVLVSAVLASAVLAGCGAPAPTVAPPSDSAAPSAEATSSAEAAPSSATPGPTSSATPAQAAARCHTAQLSAKLGPRSKPGTSDQAWLPLTYTNTSQQACVLRGVPGVDLHGPNDPNGPVYSLYRKDTGAPGVTLRPGASASARLVVLSDSPGSFGSFGSTNWVPTQLVTTPPGETTTLTVPWPARLTVSRQDAATHPGTWVESVS